MRELRYVAHKVDGGMTMRIFKTKRRALKAARELLDHDPDVEVGPMVDTREGILRGEQLRRVVE